MARTMGNTHRSIGLLLFTLIRLWDFYLTAPPSLRMLAAIITTTLRDDVFRRDPTTTAFKADMGRPHRPRSRRLHHHRHNSEPACSARPTHPASARHPDRQPRAHPRKNEAGGPAFHERRRGPARHAAQRDVPRARMSRRMPF